MAVANMAGRLAIRYGVSEESAVKAGILHDVLKQMKMDDLLGQGIEIGSELREVWRQFPAVFHAFAAPLYLGQVLGVDDESVLDAVKWHTTGTANMGPVAKVLYVADFVGPDRDISGLDVIRELADRDLDEACLGISILVIKQLMLAQKEVHEETINCYHFYLGQMGPDSKKEIFLRVGAL
tara:strand:- start:191 stop:733 length:543 start_codon:yes stop_codon:yes gene_type:complete